MAADRFVSRVPARPGFWGLIGVPALAAALLLAVDTYLVPGIFSLPLLLLILLILLAMRLPPLAVAMWTLFFGGVLLIFFLLPNQDTTTNPVFRPYIRTAIFLAGGSAAILLASYRQRIEAGQDAFFRIVAALPFAVIVSDISGDILLLNDQAREVLRNHMDEMAGLSYFSTFINPHDQGKSIARYIAYFDPAHAGTITTVLHTRGQPPLELHASITVVAIDRHRYALTVVERVEPAEHRPA